MKKDSSMKLANQLSYGILGVLEAAWAPMVPYVKSGMNLDDAQFGQLLFSMGVGSLCALPVVGPLVNRFGPRAIAIISGVLMALALAVISFSDSKLMVSLMLGCIGASMIGVDVALSVNAIIVEKKKKKPLMSGFHAGYSLGTIIGALTMSVMLSVGFNLSLSAVFLALVMGVMMVIGCQPLFNEVKTFDEHNSQREVKTSGFRIPPVIIVLGLMCFIMYGSEGALLSWTTVFATQNRGISPEHAGYFYAFFAVSMTAIRFAGNRIVEKAGRRRTVVIGGLLVTLGFMLTAIIPHYAGIMIGLTLIGLGAGNIVPQVVSYAGLVKGIKISYAISLVNALGYCGTMCGPVIIGYVSKISSLEISFIVLALSVLAVAAASIKILKPSDK